MRLIIRNLQTYITVFFLSAIAACQSTPANTSAQNVRQIKATIANTEKYEFRTGMSGDAQGATISRSPDHAILNTIVRDSTTHWEPVYEYQAKPDFVGSDSVELTLIDHQLSDGQTEFITTKSQVVIVFTITE